MAVLDWDVGKSERHAVMARILTLCYIAKASRLPTGV